MARDGTNRGGARPGAGRPKKALSEKIAEGNPGGRALPRSTVESILTNEKYRGSALLQKSFTVDFLTKKQK